MRTNESPELKAASLAVGVFIGLSPLWGFHTGLAIAMAVLFRLNKVITILFSNISIPPLIPFIIYFGHATGALWMGSRAVHLSFDNEITFQSITSSYFQYFVGGFTLAAIVAATMGLITYAVLLWKKKSV